MALAELLRQKAELERAIASAQSEARTKAMGEIRAVMNQYGLTAADLSAPSKVRSAARPDTARRPVAAKYRDSNGNQWSGRGLKPKWLVAALADGKTLKDFAI